MYMIGETEGRALSYMGFAARGKREGLLIEEYRFPLDVSDIA